MRNLALFGSIIIIIVLAGLFLNAYITQEVAVFKYESDAHKEACMIYESREAPESYLIKNNCK